MKRTDPDLEPCDSPAGHEWRETDELPCETCGPAHSGVYCNNCCQSVDFAWYDDPRDA